MKKLLKFPAVSCFLNKFLKKRMFQQPAAALSTIMKIQNQNKSKKERENSKQIENELEIWLAWLGPCLFVCLFGGL